MLEGFCSGAHAKADFQGKDEMIAKAEAAAIVHIDSVRETEMKGLSLAYHQVASASVIDLIKGELPKKFLLYGAEDFICARCPLATGTYLAFLKKDGDLWAGSNWHLSLREISSDKVTWYRTEKDLSDTQPIALNQVEQPR